MGPSRPDELVEAGGDAALDARLPALLAERGDRGDPAVSALRG
jgi:hypothetical protein